MRTLFTKTERRKPEPVREVRARLPGTRCRRVPKPAPPVARRSRIGLAARGERGSLEPVAKDELIQTRDCQRKQQADAGK